MAQPLRVHTWIPSPIAAVGLKRSARGTKATFVAWGNNTFMSPKIAIVTSAARPVACRNHASARHIPVQQLLLSQRCPTTQSPACARLLERFDLRRDHFGALGIAGARVNIGGVPIIIKRAWPILQLQPGIAARAISGAVVGVDLQR